MKALGRYRGKSGIRRGNRRGERVRTAEGPYKLERASVKRRPGREIRAWRKRNRERRNFQKLPPLQKV